MEAIEDGALHYQQKVLVFHLWGVAKKKKVLLSIRDNNTHLPFFNVPGGWSFEGKRGKKPDWGLQHLVNCVPQLSWGLNDVSRLFL